MNHLVTKHPLAAPGTAMRLDMKHIAMRDDGELTFSNESGDVLMKLSAEEVKQLDTFLTKCEGMFDK